MKQYHAATPSFITGSLAILRRHKYRMFYGMKWHCLSLAYVYANNLYLYMFNYYVTVFVIKYSQF